MASERNSPMSKGESISLKYAHVENERRFLIRNPVAAASDARRLYIRDRYLVGTRLRLRRVEEPGLPTVYKLGQKIRFDGGSPSENAHTTIYLSAEEFACLAQVPANELEKVRWVNPIGKLSLSIDEFGGRLTGLVLAEVDLGSTGTMPSTFPIELNAEVTNDERFTGGELAMTTTQELTSILDSFHIR
ncbi:MAG: hypothetical protein Q8K86_02320 [Candidatus Nanopelagicaceae bacterium]|nr:hypothetical protein [Candidatus Nanopelagicaceae bacterium]